MKLAFSFGREEQKSPNIDTYKTDDPINKPWTVKRKSIDPNTLYPAHDGLPSLAITSITQLDSLKQIKAMFDKLFIGVRTFEK